MASEADNWPVLDDPGSASANPATPGGAAEEGDSIVVEDCYSYLPDSPGVGVLLLRRGAKDGLASIRYNYVNLITSTSESEVLIMLSHYKVTIKGVRLWPLFGELHHGRATEVRVVEHEQQKQKLKKEQKTIVDTIRVEQLYGDEEESTDDESSTPST